MIKAVGIVDCNSFYASCEKIFRPELADKPVVVLSNNDGIVIALSQEAKKCGIKRGSPLFKIKDLVKRYNVQVFSSNYALYGDISQRVFSLVDSIVPDMEIYSIDEAFINFTNVNLDLAQFCRNLRMKIHKGVGIPTSIGIAKTKTLSKIANKIAKNDASLRGVCDISNMADISSILKRVPVDDIWGVGWKHSERLRKSGIETAYDFSRANEKWVKKHMTVQGLRTLYELQGKPCIDLSTAVPAKQSILSSRSFGRIIRSKEEILEAVASYTARAAEKMRKQSSAANLLYVFLRTNPFNQTRQYHNGVQIPLPVPTSATSELLSYAAAGVEQIYREGFDYQKAGIMLSGLVPCNLDQFAMFDPEDRQKLKTVTVVMDEINKKMGRNTLFYAAAGVKKPWDMRREFESPHYTTRWKDLPGVKAE